MRLLEGDQAGNKLKHSEVVGRQSLPSNQETPKSIVPAIGSFDYPATRLATHAPDHRRLAASSNVWDDASSAHLSITVVEVVALVQAEVARSKRSPSLAKRNGIERRGDLPLVVNVGASDQYRHGDSAPVDEYVALHAQFAAIRRIWTCVAPPFGALAMALSSEAKSHLMPRRFS
jgi:hypothetical protein